LTSTRVKAMAMAIGAVLLCGALVSYHSLSGPGNAPPPLAGYFTLKPVGAYASLPNDATAAAEVHRSGWEPRPGNTSYTQTVPGKLKLRPVSIASRAYSPLWNKYILDRITGDFRGTTDEIFQWAAAKWGLPDNLLRTVAYMESGWRQSNFGDYVDDPAECPHGYQAIPCPTTFGIVGTKSTSWPGIFPWNRDSTAVAARLLRGLGLVAGRAREPVPRCIPRREHLGLCRSLVFGQLAGRFGRQSAQRRELHLPGAALVPDAALARQLVLTGPRITGGTLR